MDTTQLSLRDAGDVTNPHRYEKKALRKPLRLTLRPAPYVPLDGD